VSRNTTTDALAASSAKFAQMNLRSDDSDTDRPWSSRSR
jgi:hypothetical protein